MNTNLVALLESSILNASSLGAIVVALLLGMPMAEAFVASDQPNNTRVEEAAEPFATNPVSAQCPGWNPLTCPDSRLGSHCCPETHTCCGDVRRT